MEETIITIRSDLQADVRKAALLIGHHEQIIAQIRAELAQMLRLAHGVNLSDPNTILDAEGGVIVQRRSSSLPVPFVTESAEEQR